MKKLIVLFVSLFGISFSALATNSIQDQAITTKMDVCKMNVPLLTYIGLPSVEYLQIDGKTHTFSTIDRSHEFTFRISHPMSDDGLDIRYPIGDNTIHMSWHGGLVKLSILDSAFNSIYYGEYLCAE